MTGIISLFFFFFSIVCITYLSEENNGQVFLWLMNGKKRFSRLKNNYFVCELLDVASGVRRPASGVRPETKPLLISFLFLICSFLLKQIKSKKEIEYLRLKI